MKSFKEFSELNESSVSQANLEKTTNLIVSYFGKKLGERFSLVDDYEFIGMNVGRFNRALFMGDKGSGIGVNYRRSGEFLSVSYWNKLGMDRNGVWTVPYREIELSRTESFATSIPAALEAISKAREDLNESDLSEAGLSREETARAMKKDGKTDFQIMRELGISMQELQSLLGQSESSKPYKISQGQDDKQTEKPEVEDAVKKFDDTEYADPRVVFDQLDTLVKSIGSGTNTALLITGQGGIGKSFGVGRVLKEVLGLVKGEDYVIMKGSNSSFAMYRFLYNNYDKIVIFDDCDSVFGEKDSLNILKAVLDSGVERIVSWDTAGTVPVKSGMSHEEIEEVLADYSAKHSGKIAVPSQFEFEGAIIFISNMTKKQIEAKDAALLTRCMSIDITMSQEDTINRIKTCLPGIKYYASKKINGKPVDITNEEDKREVMDYMLSTEFREMLDRKSSVQISFRTLINLCKLKAADPSNWKSCAALAV